MSIDFGDLAEHDGSGQETRTVIEYKQKLRVLDIAEPSYTSFKHLQGRASLEATALRGCGRLHGHGRPVFGETFDA